MWQKYKGPSVIAVQSEDSEECLKALAEVLPDLTVNRSIPGTVFVEARTAGAGLHYPKLTIGHAIIVDWQTCTVQSLPPVVFKERYTPMSIEGQVEQACPRPRIFGGGYIQLDEAETLCGGTLETQAPAGPDVVGEGEPPAAEPGEQVGACNPVQ